MPGAWPARLPWLPAARRRAHRLLPSSIRSGRARSRARCVRGLREGGQHPRLHLGSNTNWVECGACCAAFGWRASREDGRTGQPARAAYLAAIALCICKAKAALARALRPRPCTLDQARPRPARRVRGFPAATSCPPASTTSSPLHRQAHAPPASHPAGRDRRPAEKPMAAAARGGGQRRRRRPKRRQASAQAPQQRGRWGGRARIDALVQPLACKRVVGFNNALPAIPDATPAAHNTHPTRRRAARLTTLRCTACSTATTACWRRSTSRTRS